MSERVVRIGELTQKPVEGGTRITAPIDMAGKPYEVWWEVRGAEGAARPEAAFAVTLQAAMSIGADVEVPAGMSGVLLDNLRELQQIWNNFDHHLSIVEVRAPRTEPREPGPGIGLCFSLGVDGFHGLVDRIDEVTHLFLIHGVDYEPGTSYGEDCAKRAREVAAKTGKTLVEVTTNYRYMVDDFELSKRMTPQQACLGATLCAAAMLVPEVGRLYIPSSATAATLVPFGSHPITDRLWSIDTLDVRHDAIGIDRIDKVAMIADFEPAFTALRPCGINEEGTYNCGRCGKCAHTALMLASVGALDRFPVLDYDLEEALRAVRFRLNLRTSPGMWHDSLLEAVRRIDPESKDVRRFRKMLRSSSILGREHRKQMRRVIKRILLRAAQRAQQGQAEAR